ncbi:MAG: T9SS type A sorting domain-containing protein, partial [Bacteroidetes bacterium]|nr:T9SS type A sorting domain-containing protein [Bacteroidota bacterium]
TDILESEVILTSIDVRNEDYVLDEIEINSTNGGIAIAQFNGMANIQPGDRIIFDVVNGHSIPGGTSNICLESYDEDRSYRSFSHTRLFDLSPGTHSIAVLARNIDEMDGSGYISTYGTFTLVYEGSDLVSASETEQQNPDISLYPNPVGNLLTINLNHIPIGSHILQLTDINGRILYERHIDGEMLMQLDVSSFASGMYFMSVKSEAFEGIKPFIIAQ